MEVDYRVNFKKSEGNSLNLCIICCSSITAPAEAAPTLPKRRRTTVPGGDEEISFERRILRFCELLSLRNDYKKEPQHARRSSSGEDGVSVCSDCKDLVNAAMDSKSELDEMESHVRHLQKAILKALEMMDRQVTRFYKDMKAIGGMIDASERGKRGRGRSQVFELRKDAIRFREDVLQVVTELEMYEKERLAKEVRLTGEVIATLPTSSTKTEVEVVDNNYSDADSIDFLRVPEPEHPEDDPYSSPTSNDSDFQEESKQSSKKPKKPNKTDPTSSKNLHYLKTHPMSYPKLYPVLEKFTANMAPFKAGIVVRNFNKKKRKARPGIVNPVKDHWTTYNPDTDTLLVDNSIPIRINETEEVLECSLCPYQSTNPDKCTAQHNAEKKMLYHVMGIHLKAFKCDLCDLYFPGVTRYFTHMQLHEQRKDPCCDICGRRVGSKEEMENHKWAIHLTKEEKAQAVLDGKLHPSRRRLKPKVHQCPQCGKAWSEAGMLKKHMKVHEPKCEEPVLCTGCGDLFKTRRALTFHQEKKCPGVECKEESEPSRDEVLIP